jgi:monofunctional biosynthetic peptidoglycan transglycosylase
MRGTPAKSGTKAASSRPIVRRPAPPRAPPPKPSKPPPRQRRSGWGRGLRNILLTVLALLIVGPIVAVLVYKVVPPPVTILMLERMAQGQGLDHRWVPLEEMSPTLPRAAVAAEDGHFCSHHGFDFGAIRKAMKHDEKKPNAIRGGSTISQQTAKNVFLWPDRSWVRKGFEAYFTVLIEAVWGKRRIMEVYLNTVEMGPGLYGVEAASQHYFHVDAKDLTPAQAARLIAILPSPLKWQVVDPGAYVRKRSGRIDRAESTIERAGSADCIG